MGKIDFNEKVMKADSFGERLKWLMKFKSLTGAQISEALAVSKGTVSTYLTGRVTNINADIIFKLGHLLQVDPEWLLTGEGTPARKTYTPAEKEYEQLNGSMRLNLAEYGCNLVLSYLLGGHKFSVIPEAVLEHCNVTPDECSIYMTFGDEMSTIINDGDVILVKNVNEVIKNGKIYALAVNDSTITCRRLYKKMTSQEITMQCNQDNFPDEVFYPNQSPIKILGLVLAIHGRIIDNV
jgi:transcriptional regulator with XRE-family HTH domain